MKKGQILEGTVERTDFPNRGVVAMPGEKRKIIVKNALPGQTVQFVVKKIGREKAEGQLLEVVKPSPFEIAARCPHFGQCGGCSYQNLPYKEQLKLKESQIRDMMEKACGTVEFWEGIHASPAEDAYRNKMEFSFGDEYKDGPMALGMHRRGSFYDIVNVNGCRIVDGDYRSILACTLSCAQESGLPYFHRVRHVGYFRHLLVRKAVKTGEILVDLITTTQEIWQCEDWVRRLLGLKLDGRIVGILHTTNDSVADVIRDEKTEVLYGQNFFYEELLGLKFKITPFSFFQTNSLGAEVLYRIVREYIGETKGKVIFDLYSGTGTIAQILAPVAEKVVGVEIVQEAVEAARENARQNGLANCSFRAGDVLKVIDELDEKPDVIVLDPPRDGVHPKALEKILNFGVERIVYIACKPTSLARDLEMMQGRGYRVERMSCVDMFPGTAHVESICCLSRIK